ncbi:hypothetical protein AMTR_s00197p00016780 [Amborella trichopoda]|uniref:Uncharacterized protein n=1 Tax=Amborella trichopoda TaxID=13333 RepID=U5DAK6_AMBTC|nr:hypothetical protein AMTR_s00197p00016780 [Amborella trichopoda]
MDKTGAKRVELRLGQSELQALDDATFAAKLRKRGSARCRKKEGKAKKDFKF